MDVSGWTLAKRMKIPDQYFPDRQIVSAWAEVAVASTLGWAISGVALPDPCCIWEVGVLSLQSDSNNNYVRMGLRSAVPTSEAEMNGATDIFPDLGDLTKTPPRVFCTATAFAQSLFQCRKGFVTGGDKLVIELYAAGTIVNVLVHMVISDLPTDVPAWAGVA